MKLAVFILFFHSLIASAASTNLGEVLHKSVCSKEVNLAIDPKLKKQTWAPVVVADKAQPLAYGAEFRDTRTNKAYKLYTRDKQTFLSEMTIGSAEQTVTTWNQAKLCNKTSETLPYKAPPVPTKGYTDSNLKADLKTHNAGLIYVWSPHMPLSVEGLREIKEAANTLNMPLTILMDGKAQPEATAKWVNTKDVAENETTPVASQELYARQVQLHYPVLFIYKNGFLSNRTIAGQKQAKTYEAWVSDEVSELTKDMQ